MHLATTYERFVKPCLDVVLATALLIVSLPISLVLALAIRVSLGSGVLYRQERVGRHGVRFTMVKFRTMLTDRRVCQSSFDVERRVCHKRDDDPRHTPVGRWIRKTSLDELPQLWNVIKGEMRLVGPRPEVPEFVSRYHEEYEELLTALPGITGPAAVEYASESHLLSLQRDPLAFYEESIMPRKIEIDLEYIRTRTLRGDLRILCETMLVPLSKMAKQMTGDPRVRRLEAGLLLGSCAVLALIFMIASSGT